MSARSCCSKIAVYSKLGNLCSFFKSVRSIKLWSCIAIILTLPYSGNGISHTNLVIF